MSFKLANAEQFEKQSDIERSHNEYTLYVGRVCDCTSYKRDEMYITLNTLHSKQLYICQLHIIKKERMILLICNTFNVKNELHTFC